MPVLQFDRLQVLFPVEEFDLANPLFGLELALHLDDVFFPYGKRDLVVDALLAVAQGQRCLEIAGACEVLAIVAEDAGNFGQGAVALVFGQRFLRQPLAGVDPVHAEQRESHIGLVHGDQRDVVLLLRELERPLRQIKGSLVVLAAKVDVGEVDERIALGDVRLRFARDGQRILHRREFFLRPIQDLERGRLGHLGLGHSPRASAEPRLVECGDAFIEGAVGLLEIKVEDRKLIERGAAPIMVLRRVGQRERVLKAAKRLVGAAEQPRGETHRHRRPVAHVGIARSLHEAARFVGERIGARCVAGPGLRGAAYQQGDCREGVVMGSPRFALQLVRQLQGAVVAARLHHRLAVERLDVAPRVSVAGARLRHQ